MARHVYSILCRRAVIDREGGQVSIHEVIERLNFEKIPGEDSQKLEELKESGQGLGVPGGVQLVSWWVRSDYEESEVSACRVRFVTPGGQVTLLPGQSTSASPEGATLDEFPLDLSSNTGARRIFRLDGLPRWGGFGLYWFVVEVRDESGQWTEATRIPLEVRVQS